MRIGGFIRVKQGSNQIKKNIDIKTISGINLQDNNLSDGDNLKEFLSYLPSISSITLDNNNFVELPLKLTTSQLLFFSLKGNENLVTMSPGSLTLDNLQKKSQLIFPCSLKYVPMELLIGSKSAVQGFLKAAQFCDEA